MNTRILLPMVLVVAATTASIAQTTTTGSFMYGGVLRDYRLYVPALYNAATSVPLVFNLHGYTSNAQQQEFYGDFRAIADTANFLIAHPNGTVDGSGNTFWNTFGSSTVDDLGFITALLDTISAHYSVDADRVYSTGMSNGGFMSHDLACFRSTRFAAIASVTGSMITPRLSTCAAAHPTPVMQVHGTADGTVPYAGGSGFVPVETLVNHWVQFNQCNSNPVFTAVPNTNTTDGCTAEHYLYTGGDAGSTVEFFKIIGGGHTWPGAAFNTGVTNMDINASREIWRFFSQYRLSDLQTGIADRHQDAVPFTVGPNPATGAFQLRFSDAAPSTVTVVDATGRTISSTRTAATDLVLEVEAQGLYLIRVEQGGKVSTQRVEKL